MKKILVALCAVIFAFNANAFDVAGGLRQVSAAADSAADKIEGTQNADESAKADATAALEAKKAEAQAAVDAKKAELEAKAAEQKAADEAKKAEQQKAVDDAKDSLNNLKNAFSK